jgi:uncharacterized protein (DUF885 family)
MGSLPTLLFDHLDRRRWLAAAVCILCFCLNPIRGRAAESADKMLADFLAAEWEYTMEQDPAWASSLGDHRFDDRWENQSLAAIESAHVHAQHALETLRAIDRAALSPADQLNDDLYQRNLRTDIEGYRFRFYLCPLSQQGGVQTADDLITSLRFSTVKDYENWLARMQALPVLIGQTTDLMREGIKTKILLPKVVMARIPAQIAKQIVGQPEDSPFFKPFKAFPSSIAPEEQKTLTHRAVQIIADGIIPAYRQFQDFFAKDYLPACYDGIGIWQMPDGAQAYAYYARQHTTTDLTPEQIHQIGLDEVARIRAEMEALKKQVNFQGTLPQFFQFLRTDPRFFYQTPQELLNAYKVQAKTTDPLLPKLFKTLPRLPYGVEPIPSAIAPDTYTAFYRPGAADGTRAGMFCVNLYKPETRPKWEMTALALHESVPGHHLQISLAQEQGSLPEFRRNGVADYTAFTEGWALYAEFLGEEMGEYNDPYAKFGELTYEMWRAVRLVLDTGIHYYHWDRQQAIDYFMANAPKTELDITNEVDRYIAWPGQALAYKIGQLKIKELRARAAAQLGAKFDVRDFHDVVLSGGALPLDELEKRVNAWIEERKTRD